jgi:hypothetical protein
VLFHLTHNSLTVLASRATPEFLNGRPWLSWMFQSLGDGEQIYTTPAVAIGGVTAVLLLMWLRSLPNDASAEERAPLDLECSPAASPQPAGGGH